MSVPYQSVPKQVLPNSGLKLDAPLTGVVMMRAADALLIALLLGSVIVGCATTQTQDMLDSRLGLMTYEEALQRFGPPTQCAEASSTKTCVWVYGSGGTVFAPVGQNVVAIPTQAPTARLTFTNGLLSNWQLTGRWR